MALLRGITSKHHSDFYCLNYFHSFATKSKLEFHEKVCKKKKKNCEIVLPTQKKNISELNQYMKSDKMSYIIYADTESLIQKNR